MTLLQMQNFIAAADCKSLRKAADKLHLAQPVLSRQIICLEQELQCSLFERSSSGICLTDSGALYYSLFSDFIHKFKKTQATVTQKYGLESKKLRITYLSDWNLTEIFTDIYDNLRKLFPNCKLEFEQVTLQKVQDILLDSKFDVLVFEAIQPLWGQSDFLKLYELCQQPGVLLYNEIHSPVNIGVPSLIDFHNDTYYFDSSSNPATPQQMAELDRINASILGFEPKLHALPNFTSVLNTIALNGGFTLIEQFRIPTNYAHFKFIILNNIMPISAAWRKDNSNPMIPDFIKLLSIKLTEQVSSFVNKT